MALRKKLLTRLGFTQGIKRSFDPAVVPKNALWDARNVRADESGVLRIRPGIDTFTTSLGSGTVQGAINAFGGILVAWGQNLYLVNTSGEYTLLDSGNIGATAGDLAETVRWARGGGEIVYIFAGNGLHETDGTSVVLTTPYTPETGEQPNLLRADDGTQDLSSGPAKSSLVVLRASLGQRLAVAGDPDSPNTVYLSAPLDATYWPADQVIQLPDDGDRITALVNWYSALLIFRQYDIWAFFGADATDSNAVLVLQKTGVGCVANRTVVTVPGVGLVFLGNDNVYALQNVEAIERMATVVPLGDDIRYYLEKELGSEHIRYACGIYHDREYWLCLPWASIPLFRLALQHTKGWYLDTQPRTVQFISHNKKLYFAGWESGQLQQLTDKLNDKGLPIRYYISFRREAMLPGPSRLRKVYVYALAKGRSQEAQRTFFGGHFNETVYGDSDTQTVNVITGTPQHLNITLVVDGKELTAQAFPVTVERVGSLAFDDLEPVRVYRAGFHPSLKGYFVQVRVASLEANEDIALFGYGLEYEPSRTMRAEEASA